MADTLQRASSESRERADRAGPAVPKLLVAVTAAALAAGWVLARGATRSVRATVGGRDRSDDVRDAGGGVPSDAALAGLRTRMHTAGGSGTGAGDLVTSPDRAIGATAEAIGAGTEPQTPTGDATASIVGESGEPLTTAGRPVGRPPADR